MAWLLSLFSLLLCFTAKYQESVEFLPLHDSTLPLQTSPDNKLPVAVQMEAQHLKNVSNSVLMAESWLRNHVLSLYPATNITTIVVGHTVFCSRDQQHSFGLILPSIKNIHHSLTRWGLHNHIKVAPSFSSDCLDSTSEAYRADVAESYIKPLISFLVETGSPYVVNPRPHLPTLSGKTESTSSLLKSHLKSMKNLRVLRTRMTNVILTSPRKEELRSRRKLAFIDISNSMLPFPPRPNPIAPSRSPSHSSNPAYAVGSPLPPLVGTLSPAPNSVPVAPSLPPESIPTTPPPFLPHLAPMATPPYGPHLPPCEPSHGGGSAGAPVGGVHHGLWCVAKPSVPAETLQEALDYACGEGNADCDAIQQDGNCYYPDSLVAHASYAFNSYWQRTKRNGGTCGFGGTAMLINSDPSYGHCRFILT